MGAKAVHLAAQGGREKKIEHSHPPLAARKSRNVHEAAHTVNTWPRLAEKQHNAPAVVENALLGTALRDLLLLLLFDLGGLRLDLAGTGERAVNYMTSTTKRGELRAVRQRRDMN